MCKFGKSINILIIQVMIVVCMCGPASAYVLNSSHILHLMVKTLGTPKTLSVLHTLSLYDCELDEPGYEIEEKLAYLFPDRFRSDILSDDTGKIHVYAIDQSITILDGKVSPIDETGIDAYKDVLLFRDQPLLESHLVTRGMDTSLSSLGRFNGRILYIIGAKYMDESVPQLWIDKETFRPVRYIVNAQPGQEADALIEFRYSYWRKFSRTWYPEKIECFVDGKLERTIQVNDAAVNPVLSEAQFDIAHLRSIYPVLPEEAEETEAPDDLQEIQQSIEDFKKRFE